MNAVLKIEDYRDPPLTRSIRNDTILSKDGFEQAREIEKNSKKVLPLSSEDEVNAVIMELAKSSMRDVCLFVLGCNTQLRISDILTFPWRELIDRDSGKIKDEFSIVEQKNKNYKHVYVNDAIKLAVDLYRRSVSPIDYDDYMFVSYGPHVKTDTVVVDGNIVVRRRPLTEQFVGHVFRKATKNAGLWTGTKRYNTHTMRKTGARAASGVLEGRDLPEELEKMGGHLEYVRGMMGHSDIRVTAKYIDLQDLFDKKVYLWMNLGIEALREIEGNFKSNGQ